MSSSLKLRTAEGLLDTISRLDIEGLRAYLHDDIVMELPYAPRGVLLRFDGVENVIQAMRSAPNMFHRFRFSIHERYWCPQKNTAILEVTSMAIMKSRRIYQNRYMFVFKFREEKVVHWQEFFDPLHVTAPPGPTEIQPNRGVYNVR